MTGTVYRCTHRRDPQSAKPRCRSATAPPRPNAARYAGSHLSRTWHRGRTTNPSRRRPAILKTLGEHALRYISAATRDMTRLRPIGAVAPGQHRRLPDVDSNYGPQGPIQLTRSSVIFPCRISSLSWFVPRKSRSGPSSFAESHSAWAPKESPRLIHHSHRL